MRFMNAHKKAAGSRPPFGSPHKGRPPSAVRLTPVKVLVIYAPPYLEKPG